MTSTLTEGLQLDGPKLNQPKWNFSTFGFVGDKSGNDYISGFGRGGDDITANIGQDEYCNLKARRYDHISSFESGGIDEGTDKDNDGEDNDVIIDKVDNAATVLGD